MSQPRKMFITRVVNALTFRQTATACVASTVGLLLCGCDLQDKFPERINHFHSDSYQSASSDALGNFQVFTGSTSGLTTSFENNLKAQQSLEEAVASARLQVIDTELSSVATDVSWNRLRVRLLDELGLLDRLQWEVPGTPVRDLDPSDPDVPEPILAAVVWKYQFEVEKRISMRSVCLAEVAKILTAIAKAEQAIIDQEKNIIDANNKVTASIQKSTTQPVDTTPPKDQADREAYLVELVKWSDGLFNDLADAGRTAKNNADVKIRATAQQQELLEAAEASRDPASAYALAAVAGAGLDSDSFVAIDQYIIALSGKLEKANTALKHLCATKTASPSTANCASPDVPVLCENSINTLNLAMDDAVQGYKSAKAATELELQQSIVARTTKRTVSPRTLQSILTGALDQAATAQAIASTPLPNAQKITALPENYYDLSPRFVSIPDSADNGEDAVEDLLKKTSVYNLTTELRNEAGEALKSQPVQPQPQPMKALSSKLAALSSELAKNNSDSTNNLTESTAALDAARKSLNEAAKRLRGTYRQKNPNLKIVAAALSRVPGAALTCKTKDSSNVTSQVNGLEYLKTIFAGFPRIEALLSEKTSKSKPDNGLMQPLIDLGKSVSAPKSTSTTQPVGEEALTEIGNLVGDIVKQSDEAQLRLSEFQGELDNAALNLNQENLRHSQSLLAVANYEMQRWQLLGQLEQDYGAAFRNNDPRAQVHLKLRRKYLADRLSKAQVELSKLSPASPEYAVSLSNVKGLKTLLLRIETEIQPAADHKGDNPSFSRLFMDLKATTPKDNAQTDAKATTQPVLAAHPTIHSEQKLLSSLRLLGDTARAYHNAAESSTNDGFDLLASNARLYKAVRTINGHLLMISMNRHLADENVIRLSTEIAEHNIQMDGVEAQIKEAGFRLTLGDLKAFHSTGITEADVQALEGLLQDAGITYIAAKKK